MEGLISVSQIKSYMKKQLNSKQKPTLETIYKNPTPANIAWKDIESLFLSVVLLLVKVIF